MADHVDLACDQFEEFELMLVAEMVGYSPTSDWDKRKLIALIQQKLVTSGIPVVSPDHQYAELFSEFLYVMHFVDHEGSQDLTEKLNPLSLDEFKIKHNIDALPPCFSFADDLDPKCKTCMVYVYCAEFRLANLPACYGLMYDSESADCHICIDAPYCKMSKSGDGDLERITDDVISNSQVKA